MKTITCGRCAHFMITWVPATPYGCRAWGIKTVRHPYLAVCDSSGIECQLFKPKQPEPRGRWTGDSRARGEDSQRMGLGARRPE